MEERSWSLKWCFKIIKDKFRLIILIIIIFIVVGGSIGYYTDIKIKPEYEVSATFLLEEFELCANNKIELGYKEYRAVNKSIMDHFSSLPKMQLVVDEVIDNLQLDMDYKEFMTKMDIEIIDYSTMLRLKIRDKAPGVAKRIMNELITISSKKADEIFKIDNIKIIDDIQINVIPAKSTIKRNIIISGVLGLLVSLLVVFVLEHIDKTIKSLGDIKYDLGLSVIGVIGNPCKRDKLVMCGEPNSFVAETYRNAIINISSMQKNKGIKTIVFTSPAPNEHKNNIVANIAIALSRMGKSVLLIDADLRKSSISNIFGMEGEMGLSDIIDGNILSNQIIIESKIEKNLDILPAGKTLSNPADLLALMDMNILLEEAKEQYDVILIDSPSLRSLADTIILSTTIDGIVLICEEGKTKLKDINAGKKKLEMVDSNILGILLQVKSLSDYEYMKM